MVYGKRKNYLLYYVDNKVLLYLVVTEIIYNIHLFVDKWINRGVNNYPQVIHSLWIDETPIWFFHMLKHKYNTKKKAYVQRFFDSYPQKLPVVDIFIHTTIFCDLLVDMCCG